jgi:hypothetical protein
MHPYADSKATGARPLRPFALWAREKRPGSNCFFTRDHLFTSPSIAAMAVMGRSANGWIEWKAINGKTLDEVKRQVAALAG